MPPQPSTLTLARSLLTRTTAPRLRLRLHLSSRALDPTLRRPATGTATATAVAGVGLGLGLAAAVHTQRPMHFDSVAVSAPPQGQGQTRSYSGGGRDREPKRKDLLDAETVKQLSGGSLSGFFAGLLVSVFSKTLVLLAGIGMVIIQLAARNGIDLVSTLKLKERASSSRILAALNQHTAFKLSFAVAFALSAFMSF